MRGVKEWARGVNQLDQPSHKHNTDQRNKLNCSLAGWTPLLRFRKYPQWVATDDALLMQKVKKKKK